MDFYHPHPIHLARPLYAFLLLLTTLAAAANSDEPQLFHAQPSGVAASLRGLSVVDDRVAWASGTEGTVLRTVDAGSRWELVAVPNAKELDFRDIHAWDARQALVISAGSPAHIYRTEDGGQQWTLVYENNDENIFFDAMDFFDDRRGIAFSDPRDGRLVLIETSDAGRSWKKVPREEAPKTLPGEAGFAASGTCLTTDGNGRVWIGLGGGDGEGNARVLNATQYGRGWRAVETPLPATASSGIFSLVMHGSVGVAVGGDYQQADKAVGHWATTDDGGQTWRVPEGPAPGGYRSGVAVARCDEQTSLFLTVGTSGADGAIADSRRWNALPTNDGYHAVCFSPSGRVGWVSGANGRIARFESAAILSFIQQPE